MKRLLFSLAFIAATLTSCLTDKPELNYEGKGAINFTIDIDVPELATRSGETEMNSAKGAIDNFSDDEWEKYDIRYMLEVYDVTEGFEDLINPVKKRMVQTFNEYQATKFELRLIPDRRYKFVVWADFVAEGTNTDLNYNTEDLKSITRIVKENSNGLAVAMDESMDAYFIQKDIFVTKGYTDSFTLKRPFGKIRVVATDIDEVNIGTTATTVDIKFYNHHTFVALNALNGKAHTTVEKVNYSYTISKDAPYTGGYDSEAKNQTLFADYIFAESDTQEVNFTMTVTDQNERLIRAHDFNTQIPLQRNHLTTIKGHLLTTATEFSITIDDNFEDPEYVINPEAPQLDKPNVTATANNNVVTLSWDAVENADYYTVAYGDNSETTTNTSVSYTLNYATEYTFSVTAHSNDLASFKASDATAVTITTGEKVEYIYFKPNSNWKQAGARFAVYTWVNDGAYYDMTDSDGDGIYEVEKSKLNRNFRFCRMNPSSTLNNTANTLNESVDLILPTNGNNLFTLSDTQSDWNNVSGTWSKM